MSGLESAVLTYIFAGVYFSILRFASDRQVDEHSLRKLVFTVLIWPYWVYRFLRRS